MTTNTTIHGENYGDDEYQQLLVARARRAALAPTPIAPQAQPTASERDAASAKRRNAPIANNRGFSLLK